MTDLYFKYKQILEDENKKIISSEITEDGLILDVIDSCLNEYKYFVCEVDGVIAAVVYKKCL